MNDAEMDEALTHPDVCICPICGEFVRHEIEEAELSGRTVMVGGGGHEHDKALLAEAKTIAAEKRKLAEEQERRRRAFTTGDEGLARRNISYRKDASGTSPAERYYGETAAERDARHLAKRQIWQSIGWTPPGSWR